MQHKNLSHEQPMQLSSHKPTSFAEEMEQLASHPEGTLARMLHQMPVTNPEPEAGTLVLVRREVAGTSSPQIFLVRLVQERIGRMRDSWPSSRWSCPTSPPSRSARCARSTPRGQAVGAHHRGRGLDQGGRLGRSQAGLRRDSVWSRSCRAPARPVYFTITNDNFTSTQGARHGFHLKEPVRVRVGRAGPSGPGPRGLQEPLPGRSPDLDRAPAQGDAGRAAQPVARRPARAKGRRRARRAARLQA